MAANENPFEAKTPAPRSCPICRKPSVAAMAPFCSKRCADVDLHRWLGGVYVVPSDEPGESDMPPERDET